MIIAFTGQKRSGKSEASKWFESRGYKRINFKDSLVGEIKQNFPDLLKVIGDDFNNKPPAVRALLQNYGTEVRRRDNKNYWTLKWLDQVDDYMDSSKKCDIVVDDCRFLNEAKVVNDFNGIIIKVTRKGFTGDSHISETEQSKIKPDYTINNDTTLDNLYKQLKIIYENITGDKQ